MFKAADLQMLKNENKKITVNTGQWRNLLLLTPLIQWTKIVGKTSFFFA